MLERLAPAVRPIFTGPARDLFEARVSQRVEVTSFEIQDEGYDNITGRFSALLVARVQAAVDRMADEVRVALVRERPDSLDDPVDVLDR